MEGSLKRYILAGSTHTIDTWYQRVRQLQDTLLLSSYSLVQWWTWVDGLLRPRPVSKRKSPENTRERRQGSQTDRPRPEHGRTHNCLLTSSMIGLDGRCQCRRIAW